MVNDKLIKAVGTVVTVEVLLTVFGSVTPLAVTLSIFLYSLAVPVIGFTLTKISKYSVFPFGTLPESVQFPEVAL